MQMRESPPRSFLRGAALKSSGAKVEAALVCLSSRLLFLARAAVLISNACDSYFTALVRPDYRPKVLAATNDVLTFFFAALKEVKTRSERFVYSEWSLRNGRVRLDVSSDFDTYML